MTPEFEATIQKLGITKSAFKKTDFLLMEIVRAIDNYNEAATDEILNLKDEGLTDKEETILSRAVVRMRNSCIVEKIELL